MNIAKFSPSFHCIMLGLRSTYLLGCKNEQKMDEQMKKDEQKKKDEQMKIEEQMRMDPGSIYKDSEEQMMIQGVPQNCTHFKLTNSSAFLEDRIWDICQKPYRFGNCP